MGSLTITGDPLDAPVSHIYFIWSNTHVLDGLSVHHKEFKTVHTATGDHQWRTQEFCSGGGGVSTNSVEDRGQRERGSEGGSPLVRGSGGTCNLVQEI